MHADDINGIDHADDLNDQHDWAMSIMDRLLDFCPPGHHDLGSGGIASEPRPGKGSTCSADAPPLPNHNLDRDLGAAPHSSSSACGAHTPRSRSENPQERHTAALLYGQRSGNVSPATPTRLKTTFCHLCSPTTDTAAGAATPAAN